MSVIVSISTIPERSDSLIQVLESILKSTTLPNRVIISICREYPRLNKEYTWNEEKKLMKFLESYSIPHTIARYDIDTGPTLKLQSALLFARENGPKNCMILTMDDDTHLYEMALEKMLSNQRKFPNTTICLMGIRGGVFIHGEIIDQEQEIDILGGYRGVLYSAELMLERGMLEWIDAFVDKHRSSGIPLMHDDNIFSSFHKKHKIPMKVIPIPTLDLYEEKTQKMLINYVYIKNEDGIHDDESTWISMKKTEEIIKEMMEK
jgi:hypothetical protein